LRILIVFVIAILSSYVAAGACPLNDVLKLCVAHGASLNALDKGVEDGDWTVKGLSSPSGSSRPASGSSLYTLPSGRQFFFSYRDYKDFFSSHCELNYIMAFGANGGEGMSCSSDEFKAFENSISALSMSTVTKETKASGTALLVERPNSWMTVVLATTQGPQKPFNVWVEISVLKK